MQAAATVRGAERQGVEPVEGAAVAIGDTLLVFWASAEGDTVIGERPYTGSLRALLGDGARILTFARGVEMTVTARCLFERVGRLVTRER